MRDMRDFEGLGESGGLDEVDNYETSQAVIVGRNRSPNGSLSLETHRFRVNENSRNVLSRYRSLIERVREKNPGIVGTVVYGSHVVGKSRENSDIDSYIFVDENEVGLSETLGKRIKPDESDANWKTVDDDLGEKVRKQVREEFGLTLEETKDIRFRLLSKERIDNELDSLIEWKMSWMKYKAEGGERPSFDSPPENFRLLFHMQLGNGLNKYRAYVLKKLQGAGDVCEEVWNGAISMVGFMERGKVSKDVQEKDFVFPGSLDEAIKVFGLENTEPAYGLD